MRETGLELRVMSEANAQIVNAGGVLIETVHLRDASAPLMSKRGIYGQNLDALQWSALPPFSAEYQVGPRDAATLNPLPRIEDSQS